MLQTRITRDDQALVLNWGWWHVNCMIAIRAIEDEVVTREEYDALQNFYPEANRLANRPSMERSALDPLANIVHVLYRAYWDRVWAHVHKVGMWDGYEVKQEHTFVDPDDGEVLTILPGDVLWMNIAPSEKPRKTTSVFR